MSDEKYFCVPKTAEGGRIVTAPDAPHALFWEVQEHSPGGGANVLLTYRTWHEAKIARDALNTVCA